MPQIIVQAGSADRPGSVTLKERVSRSDLNNDHFAGQLMQRIGWALLDAEDIEASAERVGRDTNRRLFRDLATGGERGRPGLT
jgi:hypothetical protein